MSERGERTRQRLLDAAVERFGRDGFRATSVAAVTRDLGVSPPLAFSYFPDKEALFVAAFEQDATGLLDEIAPAAGDLAGWVGVVPRALGALDTHPLVRRALTGEERDLAGRLVELPAVQGLRSRLRADLGAAADAGMLRPGLELDGIASGIFALLLSSLVAAVQTGAALREDLQRGVVALVTAALLP